MTWGVALDTKPWFTWVSLSGVTAQQALRVVADTWRHRVVMWSRSMRC